MFIVKYLHCGQNSALSYFDLSQKTRYREIDSVLSYLNYNDESFVLTVMKITFAPTVTL